MTWVKYLVGAEKTSWAVYLTDTDAYVTSLLSNQRGHDRTVDNYHWAKRADSLAGRTRPAQPLLTDGAGRGGSRAGDTSASCCESHHNTSHAFVCSLSRVFPAKNMLQP